MYVLENSDIRSLLTLSDWLCFILVCIATLGAVLYSHRIKKYKTTSKNNSNSNSTSLIEYLIMGRQLSMPLFIATLVSTWYGGIFGVTRIAFEQGIYNFFTQGVFYYITYIIFALCLAKKIRSFKVLTLPELIKKLYGPKSAKLSAVLIFIKTLPITYAMSIGIFLQCIFPISLNQAITLGVFFAAFYTVFGGLKAVVFSDFIQFLTMCIGVASVIYFSIINFGGYEFLSNNLPASYFTFHGTHSISTMLVWLFIAFSTTFINPAFYQRCFAAKSDKVAVTGILISTLIWIGFDLCTTMGAMYARATIPTADPTHAYMIYSLQILPAGWRGLFLASIAATILSTLDSFLFIASNILSYDLKMFRMKSIHMQHFIALFITATISIFVSIMFDGHIELMWLTLKSYFSACLLVPILWGYILPTSITDKQFVNCSLLGCITITLWKYTDLSNIYAIDSFYVGNITTLSFLLTCSGIQLFYDYRKRSSFN
jgi:solute:Na+ symporter, SSS family